jgi:hypothetical protein
MRLREPTIRKPMAYWYAQMRVVAGKVLYVIWICVLREFGSVNL